MTDDAALVPAARLGIAMQLTNIARDVAEDWSRGRLYLPAEWLARVPEPSVPLPDELLAPAVRRCLELADRYYQSAEAGVQYLSPRCELAIRTAARVYRAIGDEIAALGYRPSAGRAVVGRARKCGILVRSVCAVVPTFGRTAPTRLPGTIRGFAPLPVTDPEATLQRGQSMSFETRDWREAASNALFALAATTAMAAVLFASVGLNPKDETYGNAPWYYAAGCAVGSALFSVLFRRLDRTLRLRPAGVSEDGRPQHNPL